MSKKTTIDSIIDQFHPELFFISEAEVTPETVKWMNVEGYKTIISETIHWGKSRFVCYVANGSSYKLRTDLIENDNTTEIITLESPQSRIVGIYRPFKLLPTQTKKSATDSLFKHLQTICHTNKKLWICGDFNINLKKSSYETNLLTDWLDNNALHKLVKEITWQRIITNKDGSATLRSSQIDHGFQLYPR